MAVAVARVVAAIAVAIGPFAADAARDDAASNACRGPARFVDFGSDGRIGAKWNAATKTIAYGRPQPDGHYHTFVAAADGSGEHRVAAPAWRDDRHQFPAAWHPAGELLAMLVEQNEHERSSVDAIPGYGAYTDYWIVRRDGGAASIAPDNRTIAFYSTFVSKNLFASRIYTMDIESGAIRELTTESFAQAPTFTPDGRSLVYMTGAGADIFPWQLQSADW